MTRNKMFDNIPQVDEEELIERFQISQKNYQRYLELKEKPITRIGGRGRGRPYCRQDAFFDGSAHSNACELFVEAARGNMRRPMADMVMRSGLAESTIYKILQFEDMNEDVIQDFEWALYHMLNAPDFDLPTEEPSLENLEGWLPRWVGSFQWIADFVGVKSNTLIAGLRRSTKWQEQCLEFAQRWYEARCRQYQRVSQAGLEKRYVGYIQFREEKAEMLLSEAESIAKELYSSSVAKWESTPTGQRYLIDVERMDKVEALHRTWESRNPHPLLTGGVEALLPSGLSRAEDNFQFVDPPTNHLLERPLDILIVNPPGEAEDLWPTS